MTKNFDTPEWMARYPSLQESVKVLRELIKIQTAELNSLKWQEDCLLVQMRANQELLTAWGKELRKKRKR